MDTDRVFTAVTLDGQVLTERDKYTYRGREYQFNYLCANETRANVTEINRDLNLGYGSFTETAIADVGLKPNR
ncbi:hypothetical protein [Mycobacteroides abscessus]|uniref:hypothetical protein n=1 Tax=Mycobacteroides abscessus TaxID=36809 RepID=UPI000C25D58B|nr:hypothetical protein [Mycobacteroides abscessus]